MKLVNIYEAKTQLSELLDAVGQGERVVICKRNQPVAELRPIAPARTRPRPIGLAPGSATVPSTFFDPLPDDLSRQFEGIDESPRPDRVEETRARFAGRRGRGTRVRPQPSRKR